MYDETGADGRPKYTVAEITVMALAEDPQWCLANFPTWLVVRLSG